MKELRIAHILNPAQLVLNAGSTDGISPNQRFLIYGISEDEIIDPITKLSLGHLEIVRGTGKVKFIQETMSIIETDMIIGSPIQRALSDGLKSKPFDKPEIGDCVRIISD